MADIVATICGTESHDVLLLAFAMVLYRYRGDSDVQLSYLCTQDAANNETETGHTTLNIYVDGAQQISQLLDEIGISTQNEPGPDGNARRLVISDNVNHNDRSEWSIKLCCFWKDEQLVIEPQWRNMSSAMMTRMLRSFKSIVPSITRNPSQTVSQITHSTSEELSELWSWNKELPENYLQCMHDLIKEQCLVTPCDIAAESREGKMTYAEMDRRSDNIAYALLSLDITLDVVPVCFEKSMWTVVAVLGIMKAGAAFALMDTSQPEARLSTIVAQVNASVILTSHMKRDLAAKIANNAQLIVVSAATMQHQAVTPLPRVAGDRKLYIQFTSGSTGIPKGVIISHQNYTSGALPRSSIVSYEKSSRVLDFASYAFDVSIDCMLCTLLRGGTICVPSDEDRVNNLEGTIRDMHVNMAHMTPSVARVLQLATIASLKVLGLGGETVTVGDARAWTPLTRVIIAYGPSECTVGCTVNGNVKVTDQNPTIGCGVGAVMWIVDPADHNRLMPFGAIGELLVEGPIVGDGYLGDPIKTAEVFIENPIWLSAGVEGVAGRSGKLYRTGDLGKYAEDGTIVFIGRRDTQVKLRGQRVELSEVEHHIRSQLPSWIDIAAEVITPDATDPKPILVAFISTASDVDSKAGLAGAGNQIVISQFKSSQKQHLNGIEKRMAATTPVYMIPSSFLPVSSLPMMVSGKLDRKRLRALGATLTPRQMMSFRSQHNEQVSRACESDAELELRDLWAAVLSIDIEHIAAFDNFFGLGGDSIAAMRLVAVARERGKTLYAHEIFAAANLADMALRLTDLGLESTDIPPLSLLDKAWRSAAIQEVADLLNVDELEIEDIYPCTPLQEALMALSAKRTEAYVAQRVVEVPDKEAELKLVSAWEAVVTDCMILRTRIVYVPRQGLMQVVVKHSINWRIGCNLDRYIEDDKMTTMQLGSELARYAIVLDQQSGKRFFVWTIHHALYDGWSMSLVMERVRRAYMQRPSKPRSEFRSFIRYLQDHDNNTSKMYWRKMLTGAEFAQFPALPAPGYDPRADSLLERRIQLTRSDGSKITPSTTIRAAWALVSGNLLKQDDIVFGETLMGRDVPIFGAEELEGPMITTVPVRIKLSRTITIEQFAEAIQRTTTERIHHEHLGLQHIRRLSADAKVASDLRTGLVIQPGQIDNPESEVFGDGLAGLAPKSDAEAAKEALYFNSYALMLVCSLYQDGFLVMASFDSNVVTVVEMESVLQKFDDMVQQVLHDGNALVGEFLDHEDSSVHTTASSGNSTSNGHTQPLDVNKAPLSVVEAELQQLWAITIGLDQSEISASDHFFSLGGDSISAMKLVAMARAKEFKLTVADIFRNPKLADMARFLNPSVTTEEIIKVSHELFSKVDLKSMFLMHVVRPMLANPAWEIEDVFPLTNDQEASVRGTIAKPRFSVQYNLMYLQKSVDVPRLLEMWQKLINHHEILRTIFIKIGERFHHVTLKQLIVPAVTVETTGNIEACVKQICIADAEDEMPLGSPFLKLIYVKSSNIEVEDALVIRMSHSQYDGISLPNAFLQLQTLYGGGEVEPSSGFSNYIYHMDQPLHLDHWRKHLAGSKLSVLGTYRNTAADGSTISPTAFFTTTAIDISARPRQITTATFLTAGWAVVLARTLKTTDVTFGHIVAARSIEVAGIDRMMGMCDNHLPVRVIFQAAWTNLELLQHIQIERAIATPYEATQFRTIVQECTDWPDKEQISGFDSMVHHQDIEYFDDIVLGDSKARLDIWVPEGEPAMEWKVQSFVKEGMLHLEIMCSETFRELAGRLILELGEIIEKMIAEPAAAVMI